MSNKNATRKKLEILSIIVFIFLIIILYFFLNPRKKENVAINDSSNNISDVVIDSLSFTNGSLIYENGLTTFEVIIKNISNKPQNISTITFKFRDVKGKTMIDLTGYVGQTLKPNEEKRISSSVDRDIRTAKDIEYKNHKGNN